MISVCVYVCVYMLIYVWVHTYKHIYACMYIYVCVYIYIYSYTIPVYTAPAQQRPRGWSSGCCPPVPVPGRGVRPYLCCSRTAGVRQLLCALAGRKAALFHCRSVKTLQKHNSNFSLQCRGSGCPGRMPILWDTSPAAGCSLPKPGVKASALLQKHKEGLLLLRTWLKLLTPTAFINLTYNSAGKAVELLHIGTSGHKFTLMPREASVKKALLSCPI